MSSVLAYKAAAQTTDKTTAELLMLAVRGAPLDSTTVAALAEAIDAGRFARSAATPDHEPVGLDLPPEAVQRMTCMFELVRRATVAPPPLVIRRSADIVAIAERELGGRDRECVLVIICDAVNAVIGTEIISRGSVDRALFPVREILVATLQADGRAFAVAHNHTTPALETSEVDSTSIELITTAARSVGLRFLGDVLVAPRPVLRAQSDPNTRFSDAGNNAFAA